MQETGLADVFEAAVFPALSYLPTLTPEGESLELLREAYPVLIEMAGLEYMATAASGGDDATTGGAGLPVKGDKSKEEKGEEKEAKSRQITERERKLLDKIVREGLLMGYHHAKEHVRLVGLFCETLTCIVNGMGILAVKHLKVNFLSLLSLPIPAACNSTQIKAQPRSIPCLKRNPLFEPQ